MGLPLLLLAHKNAGVSQPEAVDALLDVADEEQVVPLRVRQREVDRVLQSVRVLIFVDQHSGVTPADCTAKRRAHVVFVDEQVEGQVFVIGVIQHLFGAFGRKATVGKVLRHPHQRSDQRRSAVAVGVKFRAGAKQRVLPQAFQLAFCAFSQLGRRRGGLVGILAALDAPGAAPACQRRVQRGKALVPVVLR